MSSFLPPDIAQYVAAARFPITVGLPGARERPLIAANPAFCRISGYAERDILGRDCRFLQGEATDPAARQAMRRFFEDPDASQLRISVVNYGRDRRAFVNLVFLSKLRGTGGEERFLFASQFVVSAATTPLAEAYDRELGSGLAGLNTLGRAHHIHVETSMSSMAASAHAIASAKMALAEVDARSP